MRNIGSVIPARKLYPLSITEIAFRLLCKGFNFCKFCGVFSILKVSVLAANELPQNKSQIAVKNIATFGPVGKTKTSISNGRVLGVI